MVGVGSGVSGVSSGISISGVISGLTAGVTAGEQSVFHPGQDQELRLSKYSGFWYVP